MPKTAALLTIHGMGRTERDYASDFFSEIQSLLEDKADRFHYESIYYQFILQENQDRVWQRVSHKLKWDELRKFLLFSFADAAGLETDKEDDVSPYTQAQVAIAKSLFGALSQIGANGPIVIIAQSLGGQVISNFLWDAQKYHANPQPNTVHAGFWRDPTMFASTVANKNNFTPDELKFLAGSSLRSLYTTGCNIPIFVAARARTEIEPIEKPNLQFEWHNFYDKDDVLGWPLAELSDKYKKLVVDHRINAGDGFFGWLIKSWNPLSHGQYWGDDEVLDPLGGASPVPGAVAA
jgi:hypothetical protein